MTHGLFSDGGNLHEELMCGVRELDHFLISLSEFLTSKVQVPATLDVAEGVLFSEQNAERRCQFLFKITQIARYLGAEL